MAVKALSVPIAFRKLSSNSYASCCLLLGSLLGALDIVLEFSLLKFNRVPGCGSLGCFLTNKFRYYWGISNMVN
ncbi:hypothetical protein KIN20_024789 [Parelaphostrongylus tenuis]|uniref:Uncharacterized protein n=1 Tax=Parelaphostrongylus tenuis TaxID=148309 RepID=A0AAD5N8J8_PARTN|nr:hypothetical protein KIN20_024789 [Parelaphostrongylus tenuis]